MKSGCDRFSCILKIIGIIIAIKGVMSAPKGGAENEISREGGAQPSL